MALTRAGEGLVRAKLLASQAGKLTAEAMTVIGRVNGQGSPSTTLTECVDRTRDAVVKVGEAVVKLEKTDQSLRTYLTKMRS